MRPWRTTSSPTNETQNMRSLTQTIKRKFSGEGYRGFSSLGWTGASQMVGMVLRLGSNLLLTRLLAPEAFGLIGTALALMTTLEWLSDLGVLPGILRHPRGRDRDVLSSGWWLGLYRGFFLTGLGIAVAWPVSVFYQQPELFAVLAMISLRPALISLRSPGMPVLRKDLNYRAIFFDEICVTAGGTTVSVLFALWWPSVWAVVAGMIAGAAVGIAVSYVLIPMKPGRRDPEVCRDLWSFGMKVLLNTMLMALWMNMDRLLGLRLLSEHDMGLYAVAWNLAMAVEMVLNRACDVHFSMLSRLKSDEEKRANHDRLMAKLSAWIVPLFAIGICLAPWVIRILYDDRYLGAQSLFLLLMCRVLVRGIGQIQFQLLLSQDLIRIGTWAYVIALVVQASLIVPLTQQWGVQGLAFSALISTCVVTGVQAALSAQRAGYSLLPVSRTLAWTSLPLLICGFVAGGVFQL